MSCGAVVTVVPIDIRVTATVLPACVVLSIPASCAQPATTPRTGATRTLTASSVIAAMLSPPQRAAAHRRTACRAHHVLRLAVTPVGTVPGRLGLAAVAVLVALPEPQPRPALAFVVLLVLVVLLVVLALEPHRCLDIGLGADEAIAVRDEPDLGLDLERQGREDLRDLLADVERGEEVSGLARDDVEHLVLGAIGRRRDVAGDLGQALARDLADALLGGEHGAKPGGERLLDQLGDQPLEPMTDGLGELVVLARRIVAGRPLGCRGAVTDRRRDRRRALARRTVVAAHTHGLPPIRPAINLVFCGGMAETALTAGESGRYRDVAAARRPPLKIRSLRAYWVTFLVIGSYLMLRLRARFHSDAWVEHALRANHLRNARRIERTICELQGLFIKVGQLISITTNFLPEEFRRELEGLQDAVPPRPYSDIEARLLEEHGRPPSEVFQHCQEQPIASASIGQVHLARLPDGTKVAVKVQ